MQRCPLETIVGEVAGLKPPEIEKEPQLLATRCSKHPRYRTPEEPDQNIKITLLKHI